MGQGVCLDEVLTKDKPTVKEVIWRGPNNDMVYRPPHYTQGNVECIEALEASMDPVEFAGFLKGQVVKYVWRFEKKWNAVEDLKKASFYLERLIGHMERHPDIFREDLGITVQPTQELPRHVAESMKEALDNMHVTATD